MIEEQEKASREFTEPLPQPGRLEKVDGIPFTTEDCEKVIVGNYLLNGEGEPTGEDPILLTYRNTVVKKEVDKPSRGILPKEPELKKPSNSPIVYLISTVLLLIAVACPVAFLVLNTKIGFYGAVLGALSFVSILGAILCNQ